MTRTEQLLRIEGATTANRILRDLEFAARRRVVSAAVRAGCKEIVTEARKRAPRRRGWLQRQISSSVRFDRSTGTCTGVVRPKRTKAQGRKGIGHASRYAHIVILGSKPHTIAPQRAGDRQAVVITGRAYSRVEHPGARPQPFMEAAASAAYADAVRAFTFKFDQRMLIEIHKARASQG